MSSSIESNQEYLDFLDGQLHVYLIQEDEIKAKYQDLCDAQRDAYLDNLEASK